jgi:3-hydroxyacyl-CoA dehydrogenase
MDVADKTGLVEVIRTEQTTEETIKIVYDVNKKMGKTAVLAKDAPG